MIEFRNVSFTYGAMQGQRPVAAVRNLSLAIPRGSHVTLIGRNGSGKSTAARLMNGLLLPDEGQVLVDGMSTSDDASIYEIRRRCAMVFQNPDNQIIGNTVRDDIAFGPANLGLSREAILERIEKSLEMTGLAGMGDRQPHELSGGQKQKLAIASALAMEPDYLVLDEATSMLDPAARRDIMDLVLELKKKRDLTIIQITHHMEEALMADHVYVISGGGIAFDGTPAEVFDQVERVREEGLAVPSHLEIARSLAKRLGRSYDREKILSFEGALEFVRELLGNPGPLSGEVAGCPAEAPLSGEEVIQVQDLSYAYETSWGKPIAALENVSLTVSRGEILGVAGHTGSGKSTLIQHLNGLIPTRPGTVEVLGRDLSDRKVIREIRREVGLLFQYPEDQLFEETVARDIAFAPLQQKRSPEEVERMVLRAARRLDIEDILDRSPFELSGGQRRRAAIAGILAAEPEIVILDEPAAGLDPEGRDLLFTDLMTLASEGATLIIVSHDMEVLTRLADRILIMKEGKNAGLGTPGQITASAAFLEEAHLDMPAPRRFLEEMAAFLPGLDTCYFSADGAVRALFAAGGVSRG